MNREADNDSGWNPAIPAILWLAVLIMGLVVGPTFLNSFKLPDGVYSDFSQEWLSARNHFAGHPIYESQRIAITRHVPEDAHKADSFLKYNAHPPAAVLVALPVAGLSFPQAHFAWNLATFCLWVASLVCTYMHLCPKGYRKLWHSLAIASVLVWAEPLRASIAYGQINLLLATLLTFGWLADRHGWPILSGILVGLATGLKLFPGLMLVYFLFLGKWRSLISAVLSLFFVNLAALVTFGSAAFESYIHEVLPTVSEFQKAWRNCSWTGWTLRVFDPHPEQIGPQFLRDPDLARVVIIVGSITILAILIWATVTRYRKTRDVDLGWSSWLVGMMLLSPITWTHYFVILAVPIAVLAVRLQGKLRILGCLLLFGLRTPDVWYWALSVSVEHRKANPAKYYVPLSEVECFTGVAIPTYLLGLALVLIITRPSSGNGGVGAGFGNS